MKDYVLRSTTDPTGSDNTQFRRFLGTINPVEEIIARCAQEKFPVLIDGAQSVGHYPSSEKVGR